MKIGVEVQSLNQALLAQVEKSENGIQKVDKESLAEIKSLLAEEAASLHDNFRSLSTAEKKEYIGGYDPEKMNPEFLNFFKTANNFVEAAAKGEIKVDATIQELLTVLNPAIYELYGMDTEMEYFLELPDGCWYAERDVSPVLYDVVVWKNENDNRYFISNEKGPLPIDLHTGMGVPNERM